MNYCESINCPYYNGAWCVDEEIYVNKAGDIVCRYYEGAIPLDEYQADLTDYKPISEDE